jgi:hypothetical protein
MRTLRPLFLLLAAALLAATPAAASQRVVLFETFTNVACGYCPANNSAVHDFVTAYSDQIALSLSYHVDWPSASDPFYLYNPADVDGRILYYGVNAVPTNECDGNEAGTSNVAVIKAAVGNELPIPAPFDLDVSTSVIGTSMTVDVTVMASDVVPASGLVLHMAIVEPEVYMDPPGADNGERYFHCTMRDMLPSFAGQTLTISQGQTLYFSEVGTIDAAWREPYAVVWVQNNADKSVLQAACSRPNATDYTFFYGAEHTVDVVPMGLHSFDSQLENRGLQSDNYAVHVDWDLPSGWGGGVCEGGVCHGVGDNDFTIRLDAGLVSPVSVDIEPFGSVGQGAVTVTVTSGGIPSLSWAETFKVITYGVPILCVDDDGAAGYQAYYYQALDAAGYPYGTWDRAAEGKLDAAILDHFHAVIWDVGVAYPVFVPDDVTALSAYLDGGGNLFISGQDVGWDIFDPSGSSRFPAAQNFYRNYLGATYVMDDTNLLTISGIGGDPISDGLVFNIFGGSGANNQAYPSEINPYGTGVACMTYAVGREAAVHNDTGVFKTVYFAFGFEGIAEETDRDLIMARILDWFDLELVGVPGGEETPALVLQPRATPNPFNPTTRIEFAVSGAKPVPATVALYDLRGRLVRTLWHGPIAPGAQSLTWDGHTESGAQAASGIYLARIRIADQEQSLKLTLAK